MMMFRRRSHEVPGLNTSSLPDLIFTVLFFFMIVTHMRKVTLKVEYRVPQGKELTRLTRKSAVSYIYVGKPAKRMKQGGGMTPGHESAVQEGGVCIQINDKFTTAEEVQDYMAAEKHRMSAEDKQLMTVSIRADRHTPMGVVMDVKQALRQARVTRVNYSAEEKGK